MSGTQQITVGFTICIASMRIFGEGIFPSSATGPLTASGERKSNAQP